jgi:hypothetical protein
MDCRCHRLTQANAHSAVQTSRAWNEEMDRPSHKEQCIRGQNGVGWRLQRTDMPWDWCGIGVDWAFGPTGVGDTSVHIPETLRSRSRARGTSKRVAYPTRTCPVPAEPGRHDEARRGRDEAWQLPMSVSLS